MVCDSLVKSIVFFYTMLSIVLASGGKMYLQSIEFGLGPSFMHSFSTGENFFSSSFLLRTNIIEEPVFGVSAYLSMDYSEVPMKNLSNMLPGFSPRRSLDDVIKNSTFDSKTNTRTFDTKDSFITFSNGNLSKIEFYDLKVNGSPVVDFKIQDESLYVMLPKTKCRVVSYCGSAIIDVYKRIVSDKKHTMSFLNFNCVNVGGAFGYNLGVFKFGSMSQIFDGYMREIYYRDVTFGIKASIEFSGKNMLVEPSVYLLFPMISSVSIIADKLNAHVNIKLPNATTTVFSIFSTNSFAASSQLIFDEQKTKQLELSRKNTIFMLFAVRISGIISEHVNIGIEPRVELYPRMMSESPNNDFDIKGINNLIDNYIKVSLMFSLRYFA